MTSKTKAVASMAGALVIFSIPIAGAYALDKGFGQAILILVLAAAGAACMWWAGRIFFNSAKDFAQARRRMKAEAEEKAWLAQQPYRKGQFVQTLVEKGTDLPANSVGCVLRVFDDWGDTVFVVAFANGIHQHFHESEIRLHSENILILEEVNDYPADSFVADVVNRAKETAGHIAAMQNAASEMEPINFATSVTGTELKPGDLATLQHGLSRVNGFPSDVVVEVVSIGDFDTAFVRPLLNDKDFAFPRSLLEPLPGWSFDEKAILTNLRNADGSEPRYVRINQPDADIVIPGLQPFDQGVSVDAPTDLDQYYRDLAKLADPGQILCAGPESYTYGSEKDWPAYVVTTNYDPATVYADHELRGYAGGAEGVSYAGERDVVLGQQQVVIGDFGSDIEELSLGEPEDPDTLEPVDEPFNLQDRIEDIEGGIADIASELALLNSYQGTIRIAIREIVDAMKANQSGFGAGAADRITPEQLHGTTTAKEPPKEDAGPHVIDAPAKAGNRMVLTKPYQWLASDPLAPRGTMVAKVDERVGEYKVRIFFANHERDYRDAWVKDAYFE